MNTKTCVKAKHTKSYGFVRSLDLGPLSNSMKETNVNATGCSLQLYILSIHANKRPWHSSQSNMYKIRNTNTKSNKDTNTKSDIQIQNQIKIQIQDQKYKYKIK